ncbi:MAG: hypothetical protein RLZZ591_904 [Pseudomonadota bacterium]
MIRCAMAYALILTGTSAMAQMTPVGTWHSIDDATGKPKGEIKIVTNGSGVLSGVVEKSLDPNPSPETHCGKCTDDRKDKPKIGMEIIRGGKKAEGKDVWEGGKILDPDNGWEYSLRMTPIDGGNKLEVRGYIGAPLLGRTQTWIRVQ